MAGRGRPSKFLTKEQILAAQSKTNSNSAAARYLGVSYVHYKKFAKLYKDIDGQTLLEKHKNQSGKGVPKYLVRSKKKKEGFDIYDLIEGRVPATNFTPKKLKQRLISAKLLEEKCNVCGFSERRVVDLKVPLVLTHKDGNKKNFKLDNLEFKCYNCSFLYGTSPISEQQVELMEEYVDKSGERFDWELDEFQIDHLKELGLWDETKPGSQYIDKF